ncbi:MAG: LVIVD repeat-containing protein [Marmoricola sp.]
MTQRSAGVRLFSWRAVIGLLLALGLSVSLVQAAPSGTAVGDDVVGPKLPLNDLEALLALTGSQLAQQLTPVMVPAPPLQPVPRATCGPGSRPLAGMQGRVTKADIALPAARRGWTCNLHEVSRLKTPGGFRTWRYTDAAGHTCAFYDTSFTGPANILSLLAGPTLGVKVVDMTHPAHPRVTKTLVSPGMLAPHESLNLNMRRGLLGAEVGNGLTLPGTMDLYDVRHDCRHPVRLSITPIATGHESGFSPDGRTFWVAGGAGYIYAFDVTNPRKPHELWRGGYYSHGLNLSADGRTLYQTDPINGNLGILDVSQIQDRVPNPKVTEISRSTWNTVSIPQNTIPFTRNGHRFLIEFDEFAFRFNPFTVADHAGAARIFGIDDPAHPRIVANLRMTVNMKANHKLASNDPTPLPPNQILGNAFHYCGIPRQLNPTIVACSTINSGLRIFDIRHPRHPREIGYFIAPPKLGRPLGLLPGNVAMSQPAFDAKRRQVYYTDAGSGFYVLQLNRRSWPRR